MSAASRILIVGGGIAGLSLARALRQRGLASEIVERTAEWPDAGTGIYLPANGVRALTVLGLDAPILRSGAPIPRQTILDERGRLLLDLDVQAFWGATGRCVAVHRRDLHRVLLEGAADTPTRMGTTVESLRDEGDRVRATFTDGSTGDYDLVVGADGIRSSVRRLVFDAALPRHVGQVSWRFVLEGFPEITTWTAMLGRGKAFLTIPIGHGRVYCYADINSPSQDDPTGGDPDRLRGLFREFQEPVPRILARLPEDGSRYFSPIEEVVPPRWSKGRVVLVGDASHASAPNMAEGAALALEDALVLAEHLSMAHPLPRCLASFESRRGPRVRWVQEQTHRRDRTRNLPAAFRKLALRAVGKQMFRVNYRRLLDVP